MHVSMNTRCTWSFCMKELPNRIGNARKMTNRQFAIECTCSCEMCTPCTICACTHPVDLSSESKSDSTHVRTSVARFDSVASYCDRADFIECSRIWMFTPRVRRCTAQIRASRSKSGVDHFWSEHLSEPRRVPISHDCRTDMRTGSRIGFAVRACSGGLQRRSCAKSWDLQIADQCARTRIGFAVRACSGGLQRRACARSCEFKIAGEMDLTVE